MPISPGGHVRGGMFCVAAYVPAVQYQTGKPFDYVVPGAGIYRLAWRCLFLFLTMFLMTTCP